MAISPSGNIGKSFFLKFAYVRIRFILNTSLTTIFSLSDIHYNRQSKCDGLQNVIYCFV